MNGFYLYKTYVSRGEAARRGTPDWCYGRLLTQAYYTVGVTALFDMLEQAELLGKCIDLVYSPYSDYSPPIPCGIKLVDMQPADSITQMNLAQLATLAQYPQSGLYN